MRARVVFAACAGALLAGCPSVPYGARPEVVNASQGGEGREDISLAFEVFDRDLTLVSVRIEYSVDGGLTWEPAALHQASAGSASTGAVSRLTPASPDVPVACTVEWDSWADGVGMADAVPVGVSVRLTPCDADGEGAPVVIASFPVSNFYPELTLDRTSIAFTAELLTMGVENLRDPPAETLVVTNTGVPGTALAWTPAVTYSALNPTTGVEWLTLAPGSGGEGSVLVGADVVGTGTGVPLASGEYAATLVMEDPSARGGSKTVPVSLVVRRRRPEVALDGTGLLFECVQGRAPLAGAQSFTVTNTGEQDTILYWWASGYASWLTLVPSDNDSSSGGGLAKGAWDVVAVSADHLSPVVLPAQKYHLTAVTVAGEGDDGEPVLSADGPVQASLWVKVPPAVQLSPADVLFTGGYEGNPDPVPAAKTVRLTNPGEVDLQWSADFEPPATPPPWLSFAPSSGTVAQGGADFVDVTLAVEATGLLADDRTAVIRFTDQYGVATDLVVSLHVGPRATISAAPAAMTFVAAEGGPNPASQTLSISRTGEAPLNWTVGHTGEAWLTLVNLTPPPCTSETDLVSVSVDVAGLTAAGSPYTSTISVGDPEATNSPQTVAVTLNVVVAGNLVINELDPDASDRLEVYNPNLSPVTLTGWTLTYGDNYYLDSYVFPACVIPAQGYVVVHESTGSDPVVDFYTGNNIYWNPSGGYCSLKDGTGVGVDFVRWGNCTVLPPSGTVWTGAAAPAPSSGHSLARDGIGTDTDSASDWEGTSGADASAKTWGAANVDPSPFQDIGASLEGLVGSVAWGDYDGDGDLDLLVTGSDGVARANRLYQNASGSFAEVAVPQTVAGGSAQWVDYDGDGDLDFSVSGLDEADAQATRLYRNDAGTFVETGLGVNGVQGRTAWGDYDNDGDQDLVICGYTGDPATNVCRVYKNTAGTFTDLGAALTDASTGFAAWGDFDKDGDLDLAHVGTYNDGMTWVRITKVYRNNGDDTFTDIGASLTGVGASSVAWGDYDNDGDLDLVYSGSYDGSNGLARVGRNNGDGTFTEMNAGLTGVFWTQAAWGDFDNDGDPDLALGGRLGTGSKSMVVYRNNNALFADSGATLAGVQDCRVAWGDYDNDGDLDLAVAGLETGGRAVRIYRNNSGSANTVPSAPTGLTTSVSGTGPYDVTFSWSSSTDSQTPSFGLSYNLRVGTTAGGNQIVSGHSRSTGWRMVPALGNVQQRLSRTVKGLPAGTYYWSVQAVDSAFAGSAWPTQATVTPGSAPSPFVDPDFELNSATWVYAYDGSGLVFPNRCYSGVDKYATSGVACMRAYTSSSLNLSAGQWGGCQQTVDFTGFTTLRFDAKVRNGTHSCAMVWVDGVPFWSRIAVGEYPDQSINVAGYPGSHVVRFGLYVEIGGTAVPSEWIFFDNIRME